MDFDLLCTDFPLSEAKVTALLEATSRHLRTRYGSVAVNCVSRTKMQDMNRTYRHIDAPTNVLTFSYDDDHDIALCLDIAKEEARDRGANLEDYIALLLVHAFLHVLGMDHEKSQEEEDKTIILEKAILTECSFDSNTLFSYETLA